MDIIIGSGSNRMKFTIASGSAMKHLARTNPIEHTKIMGNLKALVRRQPKRRMTPEAYERLQHRNKTARFGA